MWKSKMELNIQKLFFDKSKFYSHSAIKKELYISFMKNVKKSNLFFVVFLADEVN